MLDLTQSNPASKRKRSDAPDARLGMKKCKPSAVEEKKKDGGSDALVKMPDGTTGKSHRFWLDLPA